MKRPIVLIAAAVGFRLFAAPTLPLSFDLGVQPEAQGTITYASLTWLWSDHLSSRATFSYSSSASSGELPEFGTGALYTIDSGDGIWTLEPLVWSDRFSILDWSAGAGLGLKTERYRERGTYQSVGTQVFDNEVKSWRVGTPIDGSLATRLGPVSLDWGLSIWPIAFYALDQTQSSSLIAPTGSLSSFCLIGPEIRQDFDVTLFSWFWAGIHHEFLWLSVPRLVQNEAGDAWATLIEGSTNQSLRALGGLRLPVPMGSLELGLGWKRSWSAADKGGSTELDEGLAFELSLSAGR